MTKQTNVYLGIDVGSISIKYVLLNNKKEIIKKHYIKNVGVVNSVETIINTIPHKFNIIESGITGSGKDFVSTIIGGITESEIIAHTIATQHFYPNVHTIFDIGGEDCKLIIIKNGIVQHFAMNTDCGGGTGATMEAIAQRLGVKIEDVGDVALKSKIKLLLPSKCGIFCQSAVVAKLNQGFNKEDILMGVCHGMVNSFLTMLIKGAKLKPPFIYQGATAQNKAIVHAFEEELNHKIIVPEYSSYMGAIGMAILAKEYIEKGNKTNYKNLNIKNLKTKIKIADGCSNKCEISYIYQNKILIGTIGNRCEKCK